MSVTKQRLYDPIVSLGVFFSYFVIGGSVVGMITNDQNTPVIWYIFLLAYLPYLFLLIRFKRNASWQVVRGTYIPAAVLGVSFLAMFDVLCLRKGTLNFYNIQAPWNYITLAIIIVPILLYLLHRWKWSSYTLKRDVIEMIQAGKVDIEKQVCYTNIPFPIKKFLKLSRKISKLEWFTWQHPKLVSWLLIIFLATLPWLPLIFQRYLGNHPLNYYFLLCAAYFSWIYAYALSIGIHITRVITHIEKEHHIQLKLAVFHQA